MVPVSQSYVSMEYRFYYPRTIEWEAPSGGQ